MNKSQLSIATASRFLLNAFLVLVIVVLAGLVGVGGAALWIYSRPVASLATAQHSSPRLKGDVAATEARTFPKLSPVQASDDAPAQLTPARYVPAESEIATLSDTPRYTYVSYNGGRQQAHLRVMTVLSNSVPAPLAALPNDASTSVSTTDRPPLSDAASRYITDARGRVIGVDGTAGAVAEASAQRVPIARALPVQPANFAPEVRVAYPVITRKALPVDANAPVPNSTSFDAQAELSREDARPVLHALPVARATRTTRPAMFGASDGFQSFGGR